MNINSNTRDGDSEFSILRVLNGGSADLRGSIIQDNSPVRVSDRRPTDVHAKHLNSHLLGCESTSPMRSLSKD